MEKCRGGKYFWHFLFQKNRRNIYDKHILKNIKEKKVYVWWEKKKISN